MASTSEKATPLFPEASISASATAASREVWTPADHAENPQPKQPSPSSVKAIVESSAPASASKGRDYDCCYCVSDDVNLWTCRPWFCRKEKWGKKDWFFFLSYSRICWHYLFYLGGFGICYFLCFVSFYSKFLFFFFCIWQVKLEFIAGFFISPILLWVLI